MEKKITHTIFEKIYTHWKNQTIKQKVKDLTRSYKSLTHS